MNFKLNLKLSLIAAMFAVSSLSACGGGGSNDAPAAPSAPVYSPATLVKNDTLVGTGAEAAVGKSVKVHYTGYLYTTATADFKGTKFQSSVGGDPLPAVIGTTPLIEGFRQGLIGMKVGGKRTLLIPASMAYGSTGNNGIPPNSGLVFDLELVEVK